MEPMGGCCLFIWGGNLNNNKITKIKYDLALDSCHSIFTNKNQPTTCRPDRGGKGEEV
jgi:hypothetical protein